MSEVKKCPKCGGEMEIGHLSNGYYWRRGTSRWTMQFGERIFAHKCKHCGYVEFYVVNMGNEP
ncbi:PF20097 family protein [Candidatus Bathyarchaeota archaeon]|jgi:predicted nucleic-acid-binding Zn-ribbon protein|nr:PF20097 family protein [Candidatus Bathyarchaeota archaeon]